MGSGNKTAGKSARQSNVKGRQVRETHCQQSRSNRQMSKNVRQTSGGGQASGRARQTGNNGAANSRAHQTGGNRTQMSKKRRKKNRWKKGQSWIGLLIVLLLALFGYRECDLELPSFDVSSFGTSGKNVSLSEIPEYSGSPYVEINGNEPDFSKSDFTTDSFETYSELDSLGRCGAAYANVGQDLMPTGPRSSIGQVKPTGWHTAKYDSVDGKYLYNRCHLIGYQLTAENANKKNLITGTRYLNVDGMLPFENMVADYIHETGNHVLYRITPVFDGNNLVASGVEMEAESVEDQGESISFHVFCYNVQPGIGIDYATGDSWAE